jgi:hypothetical protein
MWATILRWIVLIYVAEPVFSQVNEVNITIAVLYGVYVHGKQAIAGAVRHPLNVVRLLVGRNSVILFCKVECTATVRGN